MKYRCIVWNYVAYCEENVYNCLQMSAEKNREVRYE